MSFFDCGNFRFQTCVLVCLSCLGGFLGVILLGGSWVVFVPNVMVAGLNVELGAFYFDFKNTSGPELVGVIILNFVGESLSSHAPGGGFCELN